MDLVEAAVGHDIDLELDENERIQDLVVIARATNLETGQDGVIVASSAGMSAVTMTGLMAIAFDVVRGVGGWYRDEEEE